MSVKIVVELAAKLDVLDSANWYENERAGLGTEFLDDIEYVLGRIEENPEQFPRIVGDARRAMLRRFPYSVYFRIDGAIAKVMAILHQRRDPDVARSRLGRAT